MEISNFNDTEGNISPPESVHNNHISGNNSISQESNKFISSPHSSDGSNSCCDIHLPNTNDRASSNDSSMPDPQLIHIFKKEN